MQNAYNGFELFFSFYGLDLEEVDRCLEEKDEKVIKSEKKR